VHKYKIVPLGDNNTCGEAAYVTFDHRKIVSITGKKYSYTAMKNDIEDLEKAYSDYCHVNVFGTSTKGRNLYDVVIGNPNAEKSVLVVSTLHAREYVCSALMMRQIEYYLKNYNGTINGMVPSEVLNDVQIHYVVMANPDGVVISQNSYKRWKANARGVDLNRNFPYKFRVRGKKGAEGFSGSKAASEKETKAIIKLCKNLKSTTSLKSVINYHAMGQIIFGDYSGSNSKVKKETTSLYHLARKLTGYKSAASYNSTGYGNFREYVMYGMKIPSITIEVGRTTCPCNFSEYGSIFTKNKNLLLSVAKRY
nr:hypothetical protein [Lachnospiraceae bacterium]